jgi:hypothetical protein
MLKWQRVYLPLSFLPAAGFVGPDKIAARTLTTSQSFERSLVLHLLRSATAQGDKGAAHTLSIFVDLTR